MKMVRWFVLAAVVFTLGFVVGMVLTGQAGEQDKLPEGTWSETETVSDDSDKRQLERELAQLEEDLDRALARERKLQESQLAKAKQEPEVVAKAEPASAKIEPSSREALKRVEEAGALAQTLFEKGDLEGLWLLGANLVQLGEPGYEKIVELVGWLEGVMRESPELAAGQQMMWRDEEMFIGRFMRTVSDNDEAVLRFGLYLRDQEADSLPSPIREFRRELVDDMGPVLLGFYQGDDPDIHGGYVDWVREEFTAGRVKDEAIAMLAQIPTEEAATLLIDQLSSGKNTREVISALALQRSSRARSVLENFRKETDDERILAMIDMALQILD